MPIDDLDGGGRRSIQSLSPVTQPQSGQAMVMIKQSIGCAL